MAARLNNYYATLKNQTRINPRYSRSAEHHGIPNMCARRCSQITNAIFEHGWVRMCVACGCMRFVHVWMCVRIRLSRSGGTSNKQRLRQQWPARGDANDEQRNRNTIANGRQYQRVQKTSRENACADHKSRAHDRRAIKINCTSSSASTSSSSVAPFVALLDARSARNWVNTLLIGASASFLQLSSASH